MTNLVIRRSISSISIPELLLLLVAIFWGMSYGLTKSAIAYTTVSTFIFIRFGLTFLLLVPVVIQDFKSRKNADWIVSVPTGVILALIFFFEVYGVSQTSASNAAFLISLNVVFTALVDTIISKRKPDNQLIGLAVLSTFGVMLLTYSHGLNITLSPGDISILVAAFLRAIMVTTTKKLTYQKQVSNTTLTCIQALVVSVSAFLVTLTYSGTETSKLPVQTEFWLITAFLVLFCTMFAFYAQNYSVRKISPTKASLLMGSEPLFGALFSMLWLNESFTLVQWIGALILIGAVAKASVK